MKDERGDVRKIHEVHTSPGAQAAGLTNRLSYTGAGTTPKKKGCAQQVAGNNKAGAGPGNEC